MRAWKELRLKRGLQRRLLSLFWLQSCPQKTESSEGSGGLPLPMEQEPSNPRAEAHWAFSRALFQGLARRPKPPPTFQDQLPEMGSPTRANLSAWEQISTSECRGKLPANCAQRDLNGPLIPSQTPGYQARVGIHHEQGEAKGLSVQKREWAFSPQGQGRQALTFASTAEAQDNPDRSLI